MAPVYVSVIQSETKAAFVDRNRKKVNAQHCCTMIDRAVNGTAQASKGKIPSLVVFPESFLHGFGPARTRTYETNSGMASTIPCEETEILAGKAREYGLYIGGCMFELDPKYPNHFFNTAFIIDPQGKIALKYRKLNCSNNNIELSTSPADVLARYGTDTDSLFPVLRTPFGNIGYYICYDGLFPEVARCLALNGAEILIRSMGPSTTSGTGASLDQWYLLNRVRAFENNAYLLAPNWADSPDSEYPLSDGHSMIVDYDGQILAVAEGARTTFVSATIDIERLRVRRGTERNSLLVQLRSEVYGKVYSETPCWPSSPSGYKEHGLRNQDEKWETTNRVHRELCERGVLTPSGKN